MCENPPPCNPAHPDAKPIPKEIVIPLALRLPKGAKRGICFFLALRVLGALRALRVNSECFRPKSNTM
jgi:hypothetical protein